jgi:hypothetical protein
MVGADVIGDWNAILLSTIAGQNPFAQSRLAAITQLAVFEAVNATSGDYRPYLGTIEAPAGASPEAAAAASAHGVLRTYFPSSAVALDAALAASLASIPDGAAKDDGIAVGQAAAAAMVALRAGDGSGVPQSYTPLLGPGFWQPTPPAFGPAILKHWGEVTPFALESGDQFRSDPPPSLNSRRYARDYLEVSRVGGVGSGERPPDRADVARYFAVVSAAHAWNQAASQVVAARREPLSRGARAFALLNMAIADGLIASMESKYYYHLWRPVTAIRAGEEDGNPATLPDAAFTPFVTTPAFPSYPSAHASASYAARAVLERLYGTGCHSIALTNPAVPGLTLYYTRFGQITDDIDDARVYGGIHFRFDQRAGARQGRHVGGYVHARALRPRSGRGSSHDSGRE